MIYVVHHNPYQYMLGPLPDGYEPLGVGRQFVEKDDNINHLNPVINELTAVYDVWKNTDDDIVGFCHYHRFFQYIEGEQKFLTFDKAKEFLKATDIILTYPVDYKDISLEQQLAIDFREDLPTFFKLMNRLYKTKGLRQYFDSTVFHPRNMFVCRRELLNSYCEWLFPILIPIAEDFLREDYPKYHHYYNRMIGFIAERLLSFWVYNEYLSVLTLPIKET